MTDYETYPLYVISNSSNIRNAPKNSYISFHLDNPIHIKQNQKAVLEVHKASMWWTVPNISTSLNNNTLKFLESTTEYIITFDDGLYNLSSINANISQFLVNNSLPSNLFLFSGDISNGRLSVQINSQSVNIIWSESTIANILGFTSPQTGLTTLGQFIEADEIAKLNNISALLLHTNICSNSYLNESNDNVVLLVEPNANIGAQIVYEPINIIPHPILLSSIDNIQLYITDQNNNIVNFNSDVDSEKIAITMLIKVYDM